MKLAVTVGAVSICAMLASGAATYLLTEPSDDNVSAGLPETGVSSQYLSAQEENSTVSGEAKTEEKPAESVKRPKNNEFFGRGGFKNNFHLIKDIEVFEQYGLTLDDETGGLMYNGKRVSLFVDKKDKCSTVMFDEDGEINIKSVYDENGSLIGLEEMNAEEYAEYEMQLDEKHPGHGFQRSNFNFKNEINKITAFEEFGIVFNEDENAYYYDGKKVGIIVCDSQVIMLGKNGEINLKAVYSENNELTGLEEMSAEEYEEYRAQTENPRFGCMPFNFNFDSETFPFNGEFGFNPKTNILEEYKQFGITAENGALFYDGKEIGLIAFKSHTIMFGNEGEINLKAVYNEENELIGFEEMNEEEFAEYSENAENERKKLKESFEGIFKDFENRAKEYFGSETDVTIDIPTVIEGNSL